MTTYVCHGCGARLTPAEMARFDHVCGDPCPTCDVSENTANPACASWVHPGNGPTAQEPCTCGVAWGTAEGPCVCEPSERESTDG